MCFCWGFFLGPWEHPNMFPKTMWWMLVVRYHPIASGLAVVTVSGGHHIPTKILHETKSLEHWKLIVGRRSDDSFPVVSSILVFSKNWSIPGSAKLHVFPAQTDQMRSVSENIIFGQLVPVAERRSFWGAEWKMQNIWISCKKGRMHATWSTWLFLKIVYIYIYIFECLLYVHIL